MRPMAYSTDFQGILGARPIGAAALGDVVFAASATSKGLAGNAYQIACVQTAITGALGRHDDHARLVD